MAASAPSDVMATSVSKLSQRIGFIGGGQMALALAKGFMASGLVSPGQVLTSAPSDTNLCLWRQLDAQTTHENIEVVAELELVGIEDCEDRRSQRQTPIHRPHSSASGSAAAATRQDSEEKEQQAPMSPSDRLLSLDSKLFVSVMAGITIKTLTQALSNIVMEPRVIRAHPNTPATVGCGCAVYSLGEGATDADGELVKQLFNSVGIIEQVPEYQQDAFTGLAGSGPAYIYTILEALSDGGVNMGLPRALATKFAAQMTMGAAKMSLESGKHTGQLKNEVTSPGGTTIRGIQVLENRGVRGAIMDAVQASAERANELGKQN